MTFCSVAEWCAKGGPLKSGCWAVVKIAMLMREVFPMLFAVGFQQCVSSVNRFWPNCTPENILISRILLFLLTVFPGRPYPFPHPSAGLYHYHRTAPPVSFSARYAYLKVLISWAISSVAPIRIELENIGRDEKTRVKHLSSTGEVQPTFNLLAFRNHPRSKSIVKSSIGRRSFVLAFLR